MVVGESQMMEPSVPLSRDLSQGGERALGFVWPTPVLSDFSLLDTHTFQCSNFSRLQTQTPGITRILLYFQNPPPQPLQLHNLYTYPSVLPSGRPNSHSSPHHRAGGGGPRSRKPVSSSDPFVQQVFPLFFASYHIENIRFGPSPEVVREVALARSH